MITRALHGPIGSRARRGALVPLLVLVAASSLLPAGPAAAKTKRPVGKAMARASVGGSHAGVVGALEPADGQVTAHDGKFWLGSNEIVLRGVKLGGTVDESLLAQAASWGMNFVRMRMLWADLEPVPPVKNGDGTWTHTYDEEYMSKLKGFLGWAHEYGLYAVISSNSCLFEEAGCPYFKYPAWLFEAPYNSHARTYPQTPEGELDSQTDFWSDDLRQQFATDMWKHVVTEVKDLPGIVGYQIMNEPQRGHLPPDHATTQLILDWQLSVAQAIRRLDPPRVVAFTTRAGWGPGLVNADLSGWHGLGNVAFDLHGYYGARWGVGVIWNPESPWYGEKTGVLSAHVTEDIPFVGSTGSQIRRIQNRVDSLEGIPLFIGEVGNTDVDPGVARSWGTALAAANYLGVSWAADRGPSWGFVNEDGTLKPWGWIVLEAVDGD